MYQTCNSYEDEFEPRTTPKPASKIDCLALPSVPEVSLIFDKPAICKTVDQNVFTPSYVEPRGLKSKNNVSSPVHANGSYAAWKEQNYLGKPPTSKQFNNTISPKVQRCQNYNTEEVYNRERNSTSRRDFNNSLNYEEKETHRESNGNMYNHNRKTCEGNLVQVEQSHNESSIKANRMDSVSNAPHVVRTYVNNYDTKEKEYSPLVYERKLVTPNFEQQKVPFNDSGESRNFPVNSNGLNRNEFPLPPPYLGQQYPYFNENAYPFPQHHLYSPRNIDGQETVKNLLQIINSQNEQIKSLQTQVDRLLKMQEENLRERKNCSCSAQIQHGQLMKNNEDHGYDRVPQNSKQHLHRYEQNKEINNCSETGNVNQTELVLKETQPRQTFMEQKVSIGVMTSFEFTVQNSPFVDIEDYEKNECQQEKGNLKLCNNVNLHDAGVAHDPLRRYKNSFNRIPSGQLENIVEDSESYMSSSQQQSSNLNASISMKDSDKQAFVDTRREIGNRRTESPNNKLCKGGATKINQSESTQNYVERGNKEEARNRKTFKRPESQRSIIEYDTLERGNRKTNVSPGTDQCIKLNTQRDIDFLKSNNAVNRSSEYYKNQRKEDEAAARRGSCIEDSLILNGGDLKINERPPTPEPSIHVEMQEYSSDDDSEKMKRSSKVGWTFYNNVLGQVNQLLQNSGVIDDQQQDPRKTNHNERDETENRALSTVKVATLEQLKKLGISLSDNPEHKESNNSNKMTFDSSYYPRLEHQANMTQATSAVNETNTSMHMKALALKYLTDEQLAELAIQRQGSTAVKHLMLSNVQGTNMSFATMRYLERYQLLPGKNNAQTEDIDKIQVEVPPKVDERITNTKKSPALPRFPFTQTPRTTCPSKILDISTLKQQPKLL